MHYQSCHHKPELGANNQHGGLSLASTGDQLTSWQSGVIMPLQYVLIIPILRKHGVILSAMRL
ncbi:MAG: hypothetical protein MRJ52_13320 [Nitrosomonas sp.]|nr:hypothetical protein [Nitrosomonas sp.]